MFWEGLILSEWKRKIFSILYYTTSLLRENEYLRAKQDFEAYRLIKDKVEHYFGGLFFSRRLKILDLGCGKFFPFAFLFAIEGHEVIGIDKTYIVWPSSLKKYFNSFKSNGFLDTIRFIQLDMLGKRRKYHRYLKSFLEESKSFPSIRYPKFLCDDAEELKEIDDESVDFIISKDLFEHLKNPLKAIKATFRVLKQEGVSVHMIHLFTSISGGHNPTWYNFKRFEPWDHLRKERFILPYGHLNKLRAQDYIEMFKRYFPVVFYEYIPPCIYKDKIDALLTEEIWDEIARKLPNLSKAEVLNEKLVVITKKQ